jgi:hypothetical protein
MDCNTSATQKGGKDDDHFNGFRSNLRRRGNLVGVDGT